MTTDTAVEPTLRTRWRGARWIVLALTVIVAIAVLSAYLTAPRPGGWMDPNSTGPDGARALMTLLRENGVDVVEAPDVAAVEAAARPDTLLVVVQTYHLVDDAVLQRLARVPGDRLLVQPNSRTREALAPEVKLIGATTFGGGERPDCDLREATRAGAVQFSVSDAYEASGEDIDLTRCYEGALVRYAADGRNITLVGDSGFMTNRGLPKAGNAALAMNLAGTNPRMIWYAPQFTEGESDGAASLFDLAPDHVSWVMWQLVAVVVLLALWKGRRIGPLVAERLPVVVRASETVEGRGRLYRSRRARDSAADALRTAALQRMQPRLGLGVNPDPAALVQAVAAHSGVHPQTVAHILFGPPPGDDAELVNLGRALDNIERQVAHS
ncbi:hypothetical protein AU184_24720 [Mycolicibacterium novocastrense]|uniref:DUF4350 domain-containing protein n=1 Tax=Mycolicibacterium novocastrense TaxID=59813 RepID=UPI00074A8D67|nr:DUF4350 domain-containing protein [Mycolicibacterium novocastrense]KUH66059.1 hypothetical protein AU072_16060 [Mycolicibacterium novocastrense]KUH66541.1 hypothetical protein AU183_17215 [Mycolicibacterium novocastrense]KUH74012.1 hypothetical protein AU184_24720 [Mycolicibacterium novocastrense]